MRTRPPQRGAQLLDESADRRDEGRVVVAICTAPVSETERCGAELPDVDGVISCWKCRSQVARDGGELRVVISATGAGVGIGAAIGGPAGRR